MKAQHFVGPSHTEKISCTESIKTTQIQEIIATKYERFAIIAAVLSVVFLVALAKDEVIIATAIPQIAVEFKSLDDVGYYGSAYLLASAALRLPFGKLYSILPHKSVFMTAAGAFAIGSLLCGIAPNSRALILGRAIAGVGSAGVATGSTVILVHLVPLEKQPTLATVRTLTYGVASHLGPVFGGLLMTKLSWRWCFYINLPIGLISLFIVGHILQYPSSSTERETMGFKTFYRQMDIAGTVFSITGIVSLLLLLEVSSTALEKNSASTLVLFTTFMVSMIAFIHIQMKRGDAATIPPRIVRQQSISFGMLYQFFFGATTVVLDYFLPIWFQTVQGKTPLQSSIIMLPMIASYYLFASLTNLGVNQIGSTLPFLIISGPIMALAAAMLARLKVQPNQTLWLWAEVLFGAGAGTGLGKVTLIAISSLARHDIPSGTALISFTRVLGSSISIAIANFIFKRRLDILWSKHSPNVEELHKVKILLQDINGASALSHAEGYQKILNDAITSTFCLSFTTAILSLLSSLGIRK